MGHVVRRSGIVLLAAQLLFMAAGVSCAESSWQKLNDRSVELFNQRRYAEAAEMAEKAVRIAEGELGPNDPLVAASLSNVAAIYKAQARYKEAEGLLKRAVNIFERDQKNPDQAMSLVPLHMLAWLYETQGRYADAQPLLRKALGIAETRIPSDDPWVARLLVDYANTIRNLGEPQAAHSLEARAKGIREKQR